MEHERQSFTWLHANIENAEVHGLLLLHACSGGLNSGLDVLTKRMLVADNRQNTECKTDVFSVDSLDQTINLAQIVSLIVFLITFYPRILQGLRGLWPSTSLHKLGGVHVNTCSISGGER